MAGGQASVVRNRGVQDLGRLNSPRLDGFRSEDSGNGSMQEFLSEGCLWRSGLLCDHNDETENERDEDEKNEDHDVDEDHDNHKNFLA